MFLFVDLLNVKSYIDSFISGSDEENNLIKAVVAIYDFRKRYQNSVSIKLMFLNMSHHVKLTNFISELLYKTCGNSVSTTILGRTFIQMQFSKCNNP